MASENRRGKGESSASTRRIEATEKQAKALELRKAGWTYEAIASAVGYSGNTGARKAVESALKKTIQEPADEVRRLEIERLDTLLRGLWDAAIDGKLFAVDRALRIMERRAALLGLDAPAKQDVTILIKREAERLAEEMGLDPDEVLAEVADILKASRA